MLQALCLRLEQRLGIAHASIRRFSNSRIPEKPLLAAAGIGAYGKNGCMIVPGLGSQFIIAGAVIPTVMPFDDSAEAFVDHDPCGSCSLCMAACPTQALTEPYVLRPLRCLQALAGSASRFPDDAGAAWGTRLYGCQDCQAVCPHNKGLRVPAQKAEGEIGPSVSLRRFLGGSASERRSLLRGTALGVSWVPAEALLRNALVAAGNTRDSSLRGVVEKHFSDESLLVRQEAGWALRRLTS
jgi:epoxyqueuosine reductase